MANWVSTFSTPPRSETLFSRIYAQCVCGTHVVYDSSKTGAAIPPCPHCKSGNTRLTVISTTPIYENVA